MSELTPCNYCNLRSIERRAKADGQQRVTLIGGIGGFIDIYVHPDSVSAQALAVGKVSERKLYWQAAMVAITDHCVC